MLSPHGQQRETNQDASNHRARFMAILAPDAPRHSSRHAGEQHGEQGLQGDRQTTGVRVSFKQIHVSLRQAVGKEVDEQTHSFGFAF